MDTRYLTLEKSIELESGSQLSNPTIASHTYGQLNAAKDNVVWVCHALTANSDVFSWWSGLFGENDLFNPNDYFIVCANVLGSHYGTSSPLSINPDTSQPYYHDFPEYTIRDIVVLHEALAEHLEIEQIHLLLGGSMGGHQALEWAIKDDNVIQNLILIATSAVHSPWGVAFNESQRWAIENDNSWKEKRDDAGIEGMKAARSMALLSYRNFKTYGMSQQASSEELLFPDRASSYQRYQGEKLAKRFNAFSYWYLSKAMDSQNVGRGRGGGVAKALSSITAKTLIVSLKDDVLFPIEDQLLLKKHIPEATITLIESDYGHDGFLIETEKISKEINWFLKSNNPAKGVSKKIGIIGFGTVGEAVYDQLRDRPGIEIVKVGIKQETKPRNAPDKLFTTDVQSIIVDPSIDVVIEVIDDKDSAFEFASKALIKGKTLISDPGITTIGKTTWRSLVL